MFKRTARFYDALYSWKDYRAEVERLTSVIKRYSPNAQSVLDVACGTGKHIELLRDRFQVEGVDLDPELLNIARDRNPGVTFHVADMITMDLGRTFDVVMCLFSSIGYARTVENLKKATISLGAHVGAGGVLLIEPWFTPDVFEEGLLHMITVDEPDLKIARANTSVVEDGVSIMDMGYLVTTRAGTRHFSERHELGLFTDEEYRAAVEGTGLELQASDDLTGRGLYVALRPV